jgi:hypothetical protein
MRQLTVTLFLYGITGLFTPSNTAAQCEYAPIEHHSGTQQVACSDVTVTKSGSNDVLDFCNYGSYWIGSDATGSVTFNFSPAISSVRIGLAAVNNVAGFATEELRFQVNGAAYPIVDPGVDDGCLSSCIITGAGNITCVPSDIGDGGSWSDVVITENITSLRIENAWILGSPNGTVVEVAVCCVPCLTDAGFIPDVGGPLCIPQPATTSEATAFILEGNDIMQYVLFTDPQNIINTIIQTNNLPTFEFIPSLMEAGVEYYIAAVVGSNLNGNVDLSDPCLDFSEGIAFVWFPPPSVSYIVDNNNVCSGACVDVEATFEGNPPFTLTYTIGNEPPVTQTFEDMTGTFQVCIPVGTPAGAFSLATVSLTDDTCTCE